MKKYFYTLFISTLFLAFLTGCSSTYVKVVGFDGLTVFEAQEKAIEYGYEKIDLINSTNSNDMSNILEEMEAEDINYWVVDHATESEESSGEKTLNLYFVYTGVIEVPDLVNMPLDKAISELKSLNCSDINYKSNDERSIWLESNWKVISQSVEAGQQISASDTITLVCIKFEDEEQDITDGEVGADISLTVAGVEFSIPSYYTLKTQETTQGEAIYAFETNKNNKTVSRLGLSIKDVSMTQDQFESMKDEISEAYIEKYEYEKSDPEDIFLAGLSARKFKITSSTIDYLVGYATFAYNISESKLITIIIWSTNQTSKYVDDYNKIIETAELVAHETGEAVYLGNSSAKRIFSAIIKDENVTNKDDWGRDDWYIYSAKVDQVSIEVDSYEANGQPVIISAEDLLNTGNTDIYYKILKCVFNGDDLVEITAWLRDNIGKEASTKVGDANIILKLTESGSPMLYIVDDDHLDWI